MKGNKQSGFSVVEIVLVVAVVAALVLVGWWVYQMQTGNDQNDSQQGGVPQVDSAEDLQKAETYLGEVNLDEKFDTSEMEAALQ